MKKGNQIGNIKIESEDYQEGFIDGIKLMGSVIASIAKWQKMKLAQGKEIRGEMFLHTVESVIREYTEYEYGKIKAKEVST